MYVYKKTKKETGNQKPVKLLLKTTKLYVDVLYSPKPQ